MPFRRKKDDSKSKRPALGIEVSTATTAEVAQTPRAPTTATALSQPPPLPPLPQTTQRFTVPLALPSPPPSPTHLRLRIRHLEADRFVELDVPKEARLSGVKRQAMESFGLLGDGRGARTHAGSAEVGKGKGRAAADEDDVLNITLPHSSSFPSLPETSPTSVLSSSTSALHPTASPSVPLFPTQQHSYDDLELTRTFSGTSASSPSLGGRHSRRSSVQSVDITPFSLHRSGTGASPVSIREDSPSKRFSGGASSSTSEPKRGRSGNTSELYPDYKRIDRVRSSKGAKESDYTLTNAIMGCRFDESSIIGKVLVQYDLLTLARKNVYFDPPLTEYHRPFLRKHCFVYKPSSGGPHDAPSALTAKVQGRWTSPIIEADNRQLSIFKDTGPPCSSSYSNSYPLPPTSLASATASQLHNLSAPNEVSFDPSQSIIILGFGDRKTCIIRAKNASDFSDMMRVLGAESEEGQSFKNETDEAEWRINAVNLAHASRHGHLDPPSPRRKLHLRRTLSTFTLLPPSPTSTTFPSRASSDSSRPTSQTPPRTALAPLSQGVSSPPREPRRVNSLRGSKGSVRTPAVVTEDAEGERRAHRAVTFERETALGVGREDAEGERRAHRAVTFERETALGVGREDEEDERRWELALRSAAARE